MHPAAANSAPRVFMSLSLLAQYAQEIEKQRFPTNKHVAPLKIGSPRDSFRETLKFARAASNAQATYSSEPSA